jgi:hypothetical protein
MGLFKKQMSETDKQLWAVGLMAHHLKTRDSDVARAIGGAVGAGIAFTSPSIITSSMEAWKRESGSQLPIRFLSDEEQVAVLADNVSSRHLKAKKELLDVLLDKSEAGVYLVVPVYTRELVVAELPADYEWSDLDQSTRELSHYASDCLRDAAGSYIDSKGRYGSTAYEFVLNSLCYAGAVLRV